MRSKEEIREMALQTIDMEAQALQAMKSYINEDFCAAVNLIYRSTGRVIITGIGKSAIIAQKIVATMNSTGTPSVFMHAADAIHGDLGIIQRDDVVICISKSGNTPEIKVLAPLLKQGGNKLIAIVGNTESFLAKQADLVLNTTVEREACPNNLAPTTSTTAQLVMGDALAVCLLDSREFTSQDFARFHPGGALGKRLYLKAGDLAATNQKPSVAPDATIQQVIMEITSKRMGATAVVEQGKLRGIITDGDIRRMLETQTDPRGLKARDIMNPHPKSIDASSLAVDALTLVREYKISQLVVTENDEYAGMIHIHDLNREGII